MSESWYRDRASVRSFCAFILFVILGWGAVIRDGEVEAVWGVPISEQSVMDWHYIVHYCNRIMVVSACLMLLIAPWKGPLQVKRLLLALILDLLFEHYWDPRYVFRFHAPGGFMGYQIWATGIRPLLLFLLLISLANSASSCCEVGEKETGDQTHC